MEKEKEEMSKEEIYNCLKSIDFMLYNYAYEPSRCAPFQSYEDMASFFRTMLHIILPEEYQYNE